MDTILHGISALQLLNAPPVARTFDMPIEVVRALPQPVPDIAPRANSTPAARTLKAHLLGELKGVSLPIHIVVTGRAMARSKHIAWHETRFDYPAEDLIHIGDGLFVTTPLRTLLDLAPSCSLVGLLRVLFSMCGLYAICPKTTRMEAALTTMAARGSISSRASRSISAFYGVDGTPLDMAGAQGGLPAWEPCFDKNGVLTDLWKRPPLITVDELGAWLNGIGPQPGLSRLQRAAGLVMPGSASPAETLFAILSHLPRSLGGEGLERSLLNRRIELNEAGARALGHRTCVGDATWRAPDGGVRKTCIEVEGAAFHETGRSMTWRNVPARDDHARANALRASGFDVIPVTWAQMARIDMWEVLMDVVAESLGVRRRGQTAAFMAQRVKLRGEMLGLPGAGRVGQ